MTFVVAAVYMLVMILALEQSTLISETLSMMLAVIATLRMAMTASAFFTLYNEYCCVLKEKSLKLHIEDSLDIECVANVRLKAVEGSIYHLKTFSRKREP